MGVELRSCHSRMRRRWRICKHPATDEDPSNPASKLREPPLASQCRRFCWQADELDQAKVLAGLDCWNMRHRTGPSTLRRNQPRRRRWCDHRRLTSLDPKASRRPNHRQQRTAFEIHNGRSALAAGRGLHAPKATFASTALIRYPLVDCLPAGPVILSSQPSALW